MNKQVISICIIIFLTYTTEITVISNSVLETCINTGSNTSIECKEKIVLTLTINNGEDSGAETVVTYLKGIEDKEGNGYTTDPYKITIKKSDVYANYPCTYLQDFNYNPRDLTITVPHLDCKDGDLEDYPTCGWKYDTNGNKITDSQGFCCQCPLSVILSGGASQSIRGGKCEFLNIKEAAFAHCLTFHNQWFSAYEVMQYEYSYDITVTVENQNNLNDSYTLTLSPSNIISVSEDRKILVKNIGDFLPLNPPESLSGYYLVAPSFPKDTTIYAIQPSNWMLIRREMFTLDGSECDKIGVSYKAFRNQNNKCNVEAGSCLNNQLIDFFNSDIERIKKGEATKYLISGDFSKEYKFSSLIDNGKMFGYKINGQFNSILTLELDADKINLNVNVADGEISSAFVNEFESLTKSGKLSLNITSKSNIKANFYLQFNCNDNIKNLLAQQFTLNGYNSTIFNISLFSISDDAYQNHCNITLKNSIGVVIDQTTVFFNTSDSVKKSKQSGGSSNNFFSLNGEQCSSICYQYFQFACFLTNMCWGYLIRDFIFGLVLCIAIILIILYCYKKKCCCCCCCSSSNSNNTTLLKVGN